MPTEITDAADRRLEDYVALTDVALRRRTEPERGLYIAESEKVIRRALAVGHAPRSYLMARRWLTDLADVVSDAEAAAAQREAGGAADPRIPTHATRTVTQQCPPVREPGDTACAGSGGDVCVLHGPLLEGEHADGKERAEDRHDDGRCHEKDAAYSATALYEQGDGGHEAGDPDKHQHGLKHVDPEHQTYHTFRIVP